MGLGLATVPASSVWAARHAKAKVAKAAHKPVAAAENPQPDAAPASELGDAPFDPAKPPARLRVLVAQGASTYFIAKGKPHGVEYAMLLELEKFLNKQKAKGAQAVKLQLIPVDSGELIPMLKNGEGDIAAGLMPVNDAAKTLVAFTQPYLTDRWCVAQNRNAPATDEPFDKLLLPGASYGKRVLEDSGKSYEEAPLGSSSEKLLGGLNKPGADGKATLASRYVLDLWSKRFPNVKVGNCIDQPGSVAWAVSKDQPVLKDTLDRFITQQGPKLAETAAKVTQRYLSDDGAVPTPTQIDPIDKLGFFAPAFQLVASANNLDWLLLAAIGQRETKLTPMVRKNGGPTGVMQVNPQTARKMGVTDPHGNEGNITAAGRYLAYLRRLFDNAGVSDDDQLYFMIAAYNAGEGRIQQLRRQAAKQGLDPNRWQGNVETVARKSVGPRLLDYVNTVSRYYLAYQKAGKGAASDVAAK